MYEIRKDGAVLALVERLNTICMHPDGFYVLCAEDAAQGVAINGTAYRLMGRSGLYELDEVQLIERDAGAVILDRDKEAARTRAEIETALCDLDEAMNGGETA